jgi:hypothetical protein
MKKTARLKTFAMFCIVIAGIMGFAACSTGGDDDPPPPPSPPRVYAAGFQNDGANARACYWKDGVKTVLGEAGKDSSTNAIAVVE